ncbi:MAG: bacteriohemerythrin [Planctomycetaceae bacterium]|nr:bacteriohemerythrin [Planctomycetaceae bacterium]
MLWSPVYETGVPIMDSQHQELFRQIDVLLDNPDESTVGDALDFLGKYVIQHFSTEEELQTRSKYPKYPPHHHMHEVFVESYKKLKKQYDEGSNNPLLLMKITRTALDWLKSHIKVHDKEFAKYYLANQGGAVGAARAPASPAGDKKSAGSLNDRLARMNATTKGAAKTVPPRATTPARATPGRTPPARTSSSATPRAPRSGNHLRETAKPTKTPAPARLAATRPAAIKKDVQKQPYPTAVANLAGKLEKTDARTVRSRSPLGSKVDSRSAEKTPYRSAAARQTTPATPARPAKALALGAKKTAGAAGGSMATKRTR